MAETPPRVLLDSFGGRFASSWRFAGYERALVAETPAAVVPVIEAAEAAAAAGRFAVGYLAYEAAAALNPDLPRLSLPAGLPLAWFAVFRRRQSVAAGSGLPLAAAAVPCLQPQLAAAAYRDDLLRLRELIAAGDSYQVNYTFPLQGAFGGDPLALYRAVCRAQQAPFGALLDLGQQVIVSASPELFFSLRDGVIVTRPMKGTAPRGRWPAEDRQLAATLRASEKERAENLMIVDLLRNDLGRIAVTGSVHVDSLFDIETYPTVQQMTSTVSAKVREGVSVTEILRALFPCGSVTGAPKRRSMEIIAALERFPRGPYCGAIGYLAPGGEALFSVAIRTLVLDRVSGTISLGVGSGVTFDSQPEAEYAESLGKAAFVQADSAAFQLLETIRRDAGGCRLLERHLQRLAESARYFGFLFDPAAARRLVDALPAAVAPQRLRLELAADGDVRATVAAISPERSPLVLGLAVSRRDPAEPWHYHKTSRRRLLDDERQRRPDCDEVLFLNRNGELCEGSYNTIVLEIGGRLLTPPLTSGLLPGVLRGELLERGEIEEQTLSPADLVKADTIWLVNALRGMRRAVLAEGENSCALS